MKKSLPIKQEDIENKIIDWIDVGSSSRLIVFKNITGKVKADLVIKKKGDYQESAETKSFGSTIKRMQVFKRPKQATEVFLQVNSSSEPIINGIFKKDIPKDGFTADKNSYLMFVYFDEVGQDISSYFWLVPSVFFRDSVEPIKLPDGKEVFRFESPIEINKPSKFQKFLVHKLDFGNVLLKIINSKGDYNFKASDVIGLDTVNLDVLKKFVAEARRNTYAGNGVPLDVPRLAGSVQFDYQKADLTYQDVYFSGKKKFAGQEIVYQNNRPVWVMHYFGEIIKDEPEEFLKIALTSLADRCRFGESCDFVKLEYKYQDQGKGNMESFSGQEKISKKDSAIYNLNYNGGLI